MSRPKYLWRQLTPEQRADLLAWRKDRHWPWHSPPHSPGSHARYHISAACFEHRHHIGDSGHRMQSFSEALLGVFTAHAERCLAWCLLPNHYHALVHTTNLPSLFVELGRLHGRTSFQWNGQEGTRGRQVWFRATDRWMRSDGHLWSTINYIHHNPVRHGYAKRWLDWPFSSAADFLRDVGREEALRLWNEYPLLDYGQGWDDPQM